MKKILSIFFSFFLVFFNSFVFAKGEQYLIDSNHWIYDSLTAIFMESGKTHFYDDAPLTIQEIKSMLLDIDFDKLSDAGKNHYNLVTDFFEEKIFSFNSDLISVGIGFSVNPEFQFKTNGDIEWIFNPKERSNFIDSQVEIDVSKFLSLGIGIPFTQSMSSRFNHDNITNIPYNMENIDINFPHDGYFSLGYAFSEKTILNFKISLLEQNFGRSNSGSVILSNNLVDAVNSEIKISSPKFLYATNITMLGVDRYMYMHRLEFRFKEKFTLGLLEGALPFGSFDLRYLNPMSIFHGIAGWYDYQNMQDSNEHDLASYLGLKLNYTPFSNVRFYSNFAMNQFQLPNENDNSIPNGFGFQLGVESFYPISKGYLHFSLEGSYATPYFMLTESPNWSFLRSYGETCENSKKFYDWIGTPFGSDSISGKLIIGYEVPKKWGVNLSYLFAARGELSNPNFGNWGGYNNNFNEEDQKDWVYPSVTDNEKYKNGAKFSCPSGVAEYMNVISLQANYWPCDWMSLNLRPSVAFVFNNNNVKNNFDVGFEISLSTKFYLTNLIKKTKI